MAKKKKKLQTMEARFRRAVHYSGKLKRYTIKQYKEYINKCERLTNGRTSDDEELLLTHLKNMEMCRLIDRQVLLTHYPYKGKQHKYFTDFIMLDKRKHIVVIEVKAYTGMIGEKNRRKYLATIKFCKEHGFKYAWVTENFVSREQIKRAKYNKNIYEYMLACFKRRGKFTYYDFKQLYKETNYTIKFLKEQITIICLAKDYYVKGDFAKNSKRLSIRER